MNLYHRDTKKWYIGKDPLSFVSEEIINFIKERAGKKILDFGCGLGGYSKRLDELGFKCTALDYNEDYVKIAKDIGVNALVQKGNKIEFPNEYFDTAIMIEVIEHLDNPAPILAELKRVASKNLLITCPNNTESPLLQKIGLTFEHMLESDHKQFYAVSSLRETLQNFFPEVIVTEREPIDIKICHSLFPSVFQILFSLGIIKPKIFFRLYAEAKKS